jgi:hypothetical protein
MYIKKKERNKKYHPVNKSYKRHLIKNLEINEIEKNIQNIINKFNKNALHIDYETSIFMIYIKKYPSIIKKYSKKIFNLYIDYFKYLYNLINKCLYIDFEFNFNSIIKYVINNILKVEDIDILFKILFQNNNNKLDENNIKYLTYFASGHIIIKCYINNGHIFTNNMTKIIIKCIGIVPVYKIAESLISIIDNYDVFAYDEELLEYASYIPLIKYCERCLNKYDYMNDKIIYNIIAYSNDINLCSLIIHKKQSIDKYILYQSLKSRNKNIIQIILNHKIYLDQSIFNFIIYLILYDKKQDNTYKLKYFDINRENYFLYTEIDKYNCDNNIYPSTLLRKIDFNDYLSYTNMFKLIGEYGFIFTFDNFLIALKYNILINMENDWTNVNNINKFLDVCSDISYYPYFENTKYPKPNYRCLIKECQKKNNLKIIKKIYNCMDKTINKIDLNLLRLSCLINNDINIIKFFVETKKIMPDIICIQNNIKLLQINKFIEINNEDKNIDNINLQKLILCHGNNITKYLYGYLVKNV